MYKISKKSSFKVNYFSFFFSGNLAICKIYQQVLAVRVFSMQTIGEISEIPVGFAVEWRIKEFFSLSPEVRYFDSPTFSFDGTSWVLRIYPNGTLGTPDGFIHLFLRRETSGPPISLDFDLGLKNFDGKINPEKHFTRTFVTKQGFGEPQLINRTQLLEEKFELVPSNILSLVCRIRYPTSPDISSKSFDRYCKCLTFNKLLKICKSGFL